MKSIFSTSLTLVLCQSKVSIQLKIRIQFGHFKLWPSFISFIFRCDQVERSPLKQLMMEARFGPKINFKTVQEKLVIRCPFADSNIAPDEWPISNNLLTLIRACSRMRNNRSKAPLPSFFPLQQLSMPVFTGQNKHSLAWPLDDQQTSFFHADYTCQQKLFCL